MSSSGLKTTNFSVKHLPLLIFISFQFCTKPAIAYTHLKFAIHKFINNLKEQKRGLRLVYTEKNLLRQH